MARRKLTLTTALTKPGGPSDFDRVYLLNRVVEFDAPCLTYCYGVFNASGEFLFDVQNMYAGKGKVTDFTDVYLKTAEQIQDVCLEQLKTTVGAGTIEDY